MNKQVLELLSDIINRAEGLVAEALVIGGGCVKKNVISESEKILAKAKLAKYLIDPADD